MNRLETITDPATGTTTYTYDNVGNLETVTYPNGTIAEYTGACPEPVEGMRSIA